MLHEDSFVSNSITQLWQAILLLISCSYRNNRSENEIS